MYTIHPQAFPTSSLLSGKLLINQSDRVPKGGRRQGSTRVTNRSAMCDFWDDDLFYTFSNSPATAAARISENSPLSAVPEAGGTDRPSQLSAYHTCRATLFPGRTPCWVSSLGPGHCGSIPPPPSHHISSSKNGNFLPDSWNFSQEM